MADKIGPKEQQVRELREQRAAAKKARCPSPSELRAKVASVKQNSIVKRKGRGR